MAKTSQTPVPADLNADGLITPADYGLWSDCIAGPEIPLLADCGLADLDADGDTDLADFALFARAMTP